MEDYSYLKGTTVDIVFDLLKPLSIEKTFVAEIITHKGITLEWLDDSEKPSISNFTRHKHAFCLNKDIMPPNTNFEEIFEWVIKSIKKGKLVQSETPNHTVILSVKQVPCAFE